MTDWWQDEELIRQVEEEAKKNNPSAQCELARYLIGQDRTKEAVRWYKEAAAKGEADAMFNLGLLYSRGWDGEEPSPKQAFFWYSSAAQAGDTEAMYLTGNCLLEGIGTEKDTGEAARWLKKALESGYTAAQDLLFQIPGMKEEREKRLQEVKEASGKADIFLEAKDYEMAVPLLKKAVETAADRLGETDGCTVGLMNNLAVALAGLGRYEESIPLKERVLELRGRALPVTHPDYLTAVTNLTSDYAHVHRYQSALHFSRQAYTAARESLPVSHEVTFLTLNRLAADYMNLCRHDLALKELESVMQLCGEQDSSLKEKNGWKHAQKLADLCRQAMEEHAPYFSLDEGRKSYACVCAELCEMLDSLPPEYLEKIDEREYRHYKEQANLVSCYQKRSGTGDAAETDPYTNALQSLVSLKYLMPSLAECREELEGLECRVIVTWVQNELCMITTVYPAKSSLPYMDCPQPADFVKSLNACQTPSERVVSIEAADLRMYALSKEQIGIDFAYRSGEICRMIHLRYLPQTNELNGEGVFTDQKLS